MMLRGISIIFFGGGRLQVKLRRAGGVVTKRVAIIGCGYIGSALGERLVALGHRVVGSTTTPGRLPEISRLGVEGVLLRLDQVEQLHAILMSCDVIFLTVAPGRGEHSYEEVYLKGARNLLRALEGTAVRHVVYTSSTSVYGQTDGSRVDEDSETRPASESGRILVATERELREGAARLGMMTTILRLGGIVGPGRGPINRIRHEAGRQRSDGHAYVNLIHRDDVVACCAALLERPQEGVLNVTFDKPFLRRAYYDDLLAQEGLPPIRWMGKAEGPPRGKHVSNARLRRWFEQALRDPRG